MCALHDGQIVDVAAPETCCLRLHSKHSTTELRCRFQKSSSLPKIDEEVSGADASSVVRSFRPGFGANGVKERPHWRQIELLAAAYSICLKPQCGHSALTFAGDGLATVWLPKPSFTLGLRMLPLSARWTAQLQGAAQPLQKRLPW